MEKHSWNKLVTSSVSMAFLAITSWATAYSYGWGQAAYYGYPWWHVEVGRSNIARSIAYVGVVSLTLLVSYILGYVLLCAVKKTQLFTNVGCLRIFVLISVFFAPVALGFYIFAGHLPLYLWSGYLLFGLAVSIIFHRKGNLFTLDFGRHKNKEQYSLAFLIFIFLYFSGLAYGIGWLRPYFRTTYDVVTFNQRSYYLLASNSDTYILAEKIKHNQKFVFFNYKTLMGYEINVVNIK
ncbi:hypothetical protein LVJ83_05090 [Uruburuella testudinis]|uniref:Uncharacterized protein n=1 Tax=Uruburuella testudinis TaxID=1282863 RepID=A0ABY4DW30_9NEIS|nr:hypothetical protein [Uruburuella testudinis]UOO82837.1 hypothetical protein LVJ83_05090 [Uruburuella testudinis]